jgi:hypothetical protein
MASQKCRFLRRGGSSAEPTVAVSVETVEALMNTLVAVRENASFFAPFLYKMHHLAKAGSGQT